MPIPKQSLLNEAIEESNRLNDRTPIDNLMKSEPYAFHREITFSWINFNPKTGALEHVIKAKALRYPCTCDPDIGSRLSYVQIRPSGLIKTCMECRITHRIGSFDNCEILSTRRISIVDAYKIMDKSGQIPPIGFPERGKKRMKFIV